MKKRFKKFKEFALAHRAGVFIGIMVLTVLLTRLFVMAICDPNPILWNFEFHHFDYALVLLIVVFLMMLFGKKKDFLHLVLGAVALGWFLDDLWFVRSNILDAGVGNTALYHSTFAVTLTIVAVVALIVIGINLIRKKK